MIDRMHFRSKWLFAASLVVTASLAMSIFWPTAVFAQASKRPTKSKLSESFILEPVHVFYATEGESAIDPTDADNSGVPDRVEDVARQIWAARELFCEVLAYPDPFDSERFDGANCIQVSLLDRSRINNLNGVAYRVAQKAKPVRGGKPNDRAMAELGYQTWTLANQGSAKNNDYIYEAMMNVLRREPRIKVGEFRAKSES